MRARLKPDIIGHRFGKLVVKEQVTGGWLCECDCGGETIVLRYYLEHGRTQSCGCMLFSSRKNVGLLKEGKKLCVKCGKIKPVDDFSWANLEKGRIYSYCKACHHNILILDKKQRPLRLLTRRLLSYAKQRAKERGCEFDLDIAFLEEKLKSNRCEITGLEFKVIRDMGNPYSPSIDKIDQTKGYTKDNCRVVLLAVNMMRGIGDDSDVLRIAKCIVANADKLTL